MATACFAAQSGMTIHRVFNPFSSNQMIAAWDERCLQLFGQKI
jgi:hypothetical protein